VSNYSANIKFIVPDSALVVWSTLGPVPRAGSVPL